MTTVKENKTIWFLLPNLFSMSCARSIYGRPPEAILAAWLDPPCARPIYGWPPEAIFAALRGPPCTSSSSSSSSLAARLVGLTTSEPASPVEVA